MRGQPNTHQSANVEAESLPVETGSESVCETLKSPELRHLNESFAFCSSPGAKGLLGKFRTKVRAWLLGDYLSRDVEFRAHLVRHLNSVAERMERALLRLEDRRDGSLYALESRIGAELANIRVSMDAREGHRFAAHEELAARVKTLEAVCKGLEHILVLQKMGAKLPVGEAPPSQGASVDYEYLLLENRFRGSESEIADRLKDYPELFLKAEAPILEMGAGRGELQRLLRDRGVKSYGYELDEAMAERCAAQSLDVRLGDAMAHLRGLRSRSLGGFVAIQVVEHLPIEILKELMALLADRVCQNGRIVLETINSESVLALTRNYFRDPTHAAPLHPDTLRFLIENSGLRVIEIRYRMPFPEGAKLQPLHEDGVMTPRLKQLVQEANRNFEQLNNILFGYQDYALIAEVP